MLEVSFSCSLLCLLKQALLLNPGLIDLVSIASQITPRKPCLCLWAGIIEWLPGLSAFSMSSEVRDSGPILGTHTLPTVLNHPSSEMTHFLKITFINLSSISSFPMAICTEVAGCSSLTPEQKVPGWHFYFHLDFVV